MDLNPGPFSLIKSGHKDVEMRLYDERRKPITVGDTIEFTNNETLEKLSCEVLNLQQFATFVELYNHYPKERLGYLPNEDANPYDMLKYYSEDDIVKYGVLAIEIKLIK